MRSKKRLAVVSVTIASAERGVLLQNLHWLSTNVNSSVTTESRDFPEKHLVQIESARRWVTRNPGLCSPVLLAWFPWRWAHSTCNNFLTCRIIAVRCVILSLIEHSLSTPCSKLSGVPSPEHGYTQRLHTPHPPFLSICCYTNTSDPWGNLWGRHCFRTHFADAD